MVNGLLSAEVEDAGATGAISQWIDHGGLSGGLPLGASTGAYPQLFQISRRYGCGLHQPKGRNVIRAGEHMGGDV